MSSEIVRILLQAKDLLLTPGMHISLPQVNARLKSGLTGSPKKKKLKWSTVNSHLHDPVLRIFTENLYEKAPRKLTKEMIWHICLSECQIRDDG